MYKTIGCCFNYRDSYDSLAIGFHILGFPFGNKTHVWQAMVWLRDTSGIQENWIRLEENPAHVFCKRMNEFVSSFSYLIMLRTRSYGLARLLDLVYVCVAASLLAT